MSRGPPSPMYKTHPGLAAELHPKKNGKVVYHGKSIDFTELPAGTSRKLWWRCGKCEHEWRTSGSSRVNGSGCPACSNQSIHIDGRNSLAKINPELAEEFHKTKNGKMSPDGIIPGSKKLWWWICRDCSHEWKASSDNRNGKGRGCPVCANKEVHIDGRNSLATNFPDLSSELHPTKNGKWNGGNIVSGSGRRMWWVCITISPKPCEHEWITTVASRSSGVGCPVCSIRPKAVHIDGRNSMATTHPEIAAELHPTKNGKWNAENLIAGSGKRIWWRCKECEHEWKTSGADRKAGRGCPACSNRAVHMDGRNSMATTHPEIAAELHPTKNGKWNAENLIAGSGKRIWWRCKECEHEWPTSGSNRVHHQQGCPACANQSIHIDGRNSMASTHAELAAELHPTKNGKWNAENLTVGTAKKLWWMCSDCNHEWKAVRYNKNRLLGCPACSNQDLHIDGRNSMARTHPELAAELHPTKNGKWDSTNLMAGANKSLWWICKTISPTPCGEEWANIANNRAYHNQGCPNCAEYGINPSKPGIFYVNAILNSNGDIIEYKGGVSNNEYSQRFEKQRRSLLANYPNLSYRHVEFIRFDKVGKAIEVETKLKKDKNRPTRDFDGGQELFISNPIDIAIEMGLFNPNVKRIKPPSN